MSASDQLRTWFNDVLLPALAAAPGGPISVGDSKPATPVEPVFEAVELCAREPTFQLKIGPFDFCLFIGR